MLVLLLNGAVILLIFVSTAIKTVGFWVCAHCACMGFIWYARVQMVVYFYQEVKIFGRYS
jgi:hypothetical protein